MRAPRIVKRRDSAFAGNHGNQAIGGAEIDAYSLNHLISLSMLSTANSI